MQLIDNSLTIRRTLRVERIYPAQWSGYMAPVLRSLIDSIINYVGGTPSLETFLGHLADSSPYTRRERSQISFGIPESRNSRQAHHGRRI